MITDSTIRRHFIVKFFYFSPFHIINSLNRNILREDSNLND
ncbi:hypothetical protein [Staphylococcus phage vB_ScaM-V1SC04]|nr:hypothetical protein [Staphylococcus phage vB_ScaM-V1SC04]